MNETVLRMAAFFGVFAVMVAWELAAPRKLLDAGRRARWPGNLGLLLVSAVLVRLLAPAGAVAGALWAADAGFGLLNLVELPPVVTIPATFLLLDLVLWGQHVAFHRVPLLWRLHRLHHSDTELDATTGLRFHPIEIGLSVLLKFAACALIGADVVGVVLFEVLLNAAAMFTHGNVRLPGRIDGWVRRVLVTPDMHLIHHSAWRPETDSNFGTIFSWWDRLFRTYRGAAREDAPFVVGLEEFRSAEDRRIDRLLVQPFRTPPVPGPRRGGSTSRGGR